MRAFSIVLIRMLAIYFGVRTLLIVMPLLAGANVGALLSGGHFPGLLASTLVPMAGGVALWFAAPALARRVHAGTELASEPEVNDTGLVRAGTFLIGVFLFVQHVGALAGALLVGHASLAYGALVVIALSLGLMLGTARMGRLYDRIKYLGLDSSR